jgi:membrane protein
MRAELAALELNRLSWKRVWRGIYRVHLTFNHNDLLSYASSIAFQILYAVVPLVLLGLGCLGIFGAQSVYTRHLAPTFRKDMSPDAFRIVNSTAQHVMSGHQRIYWTTAGVLVTLWGISGAVRAMFVPLNRIYQAEETRSFWNRLRTSFLVAALIVVLVYSAVLAIYLPRLAHVHGILSVLLFIGRWLLALVLLMAAVGAIVRLVPAKKRPAQWVSIGAVLSTLSWIGSSLLFTAYVSVVSYTSIYGVLAIVVVLLAYLYYGSVSLLFGMVVDSLLRDEAGSREKG